LGDSEHKASLLGIMAAILASLHMQIASDLFRGPQLQGAFNFVNVRATHLFDR